MRFLYKTKMTPGWHSYGSREDFAYATSYLVNHYLVDKVKVTFAERTVFSLRKKP